MRLPSHTLRGCVDWNILACNMIARFDSHTLRGCVDWNTEASSKGLRDGRSHPSWVCGLKPHGMPLWSALQRSHPSWVCGLKQSLVNRVLINSSRHTLRGCVDWNRPKVLASKNPIMSHPSWVCGLKRRSPLEGWERYAVTPFVGVWIETSACRSIWQSTLVTPFVGVWIETPEWWRLTTMMQVTPFVGVWIETRQRRMRRMPLTVTPFVGVWIETIPCVVATSTVPSHPLWVCGLKLSK